MQSIKISETKQYMTISEVALLFTDKRMIR